MGLQISEVGKGLIKDSEVFKSKMYPCPAGHCTIGYGHLIHRGPVCTGHPEITDAVLVHFGLTREKALKLEAPFVNGLTEPEADALLSEDLKTYEGTVRRLVKVPVDQLEYDALVDFEYNTGALGKSTLLKKLNAGDYDGACAEFDKWVNANGKRLAGLVVRRDKEQALFSRDLPRVLVGE